MEERNPLQFVAEKKGIVDVFEILQSENMLILPHSHLIDGLDLEFSIANKFPLEFCYFILFIFY